MIRRVKLPKETPPPRRIDYQWRVDQAAGFEKASLIYDKDGRLVAVDYQSAKKRPEQRA